MVLAAQLLLLPGLLIRTAFGNAGGCGGTHVDVVAHGDWRGRGWLGLSYARGPVTDDGRRGFRAGGRRAGRFNGRDVEGMRRYACEQVEWWPVWRLWEAAGVFKDSKTCWVPLSSLVARYEVARVPPSFMDEVRCRELPSLF